jgi:acid phosphatase
MGTAGNAGSTVSAASVPSPGVTKVLTVIEENESATPALAQMPYLAQLTRTWGSAPQYAAVAHPSLPDYLAMASGHPTGITDDAGPAQHPVHGQSIFGQALANGHTATVYAEGMPQNCDQGNSGTYAVRHTAWPYFVDEQQECARHQVPLGSLTSGALASDIAAGTLPDVGWAIPDLCNDGHKCPSHGPDLGVADHWLQQWLPVVLAGPDFRAGRLAVVVTFDEGGASQNVAFTVVAPASKGIVASGQFDHYDWSRMVDEVLGLPPLAGPGGPSLAAALRLV